MLSNPSVTPVVALPADPAGAASPSAASTNTRPEVRIKPSAGNRKGHDRPVVEMNIHGWREALKALGVEFRYNLRGKRFEARQDGKPRWKRWRPSTDRFEARIREEDLPDNFAKAVKHGKQETTVPYLVSKARWGEFVDAHGDTCAVDPFKEWLDSLPPWDGTARIQYLAIEHLGAEETSLNMFASGQPLIAACAYAEAGEREELKLDECPLYQGDEDLGKSSLYSFTVKLIDPEWFSDSLRLTDSTKEWGEKLESRVLVEIPEMAGATRADVALMKAVLTAENDGGDRKAYAKRSESQPRRAALIMTANPWNCLPNDKALHRRFIVVECGVAPGWEKRELSDIKRGVKKDLPQLWAEALHYSRRGGFMGLTQPGAPFLPKDLKPAAREVAARHGYAGSTVDDAMEYRMDDIEGLSLHDVLLHMNLVGPHETPHTSRSQAQARVALGRMGFKSVKAFHADGKQRRVWARDPHYRPPPGYAPAIPEKGDSLERMAAMATNNLARHRHLAEGGSPETAPRLPMTLSAAPPPEPPPDSGEDYEAPF